MVHDDEHGPNLPYRQYSLTAQKITGCIAKVNQIANRPILQLKWVPLEFLAIRGE
jgi:hypothetical protein